MAVSHDLPLVSTVAVGLSLAFLLGMIASKLRIPPIVGYLFAGILIGPHTRGFVADTDIANELAEIGIVLLMFGVGLHFSVKDLIEVKRIAIPGAIAQMGSAIAMGAGLALFWGWPMASGIMFGLALSVASTVVLLRSLEDHNELQTTNGQIAIGWLIVEDLAMVLALVLVPALALADSAAGAGAQSVAMKLGVAVAKIAVFIALMLIGGKRLLPWMLQEVAKTRSRELFTLAVFAVAVGLAFGASVLFGVSLALGAFFAGMMIKESDMNHEVADRILPFQDAFAVLFFVAVGMLFNPDILIEQPLKVLLVVFIITVGKSLAALTIVLLFRYPLKTGLLVSAGLAQIGEFSFILVGLGVTYDLIPVEGRDLVLAGALVSIAVNPLMFWSVRWWHDYASVHPKIAKILDLRETHLTHLGVEEEQQLKDLVIVAGYGKIGREVCDNIIASDMDLVIVDANRERVEMLRELGYHAITGDATRPETLHEAVIHKAAAIVVAVPNAFEGRQIVDTAREIKPNIRVVVRAHNDEEVSYFHERNVDFVTTGARELGRAIIQHLEEMRSGVIPLVKADR
jgi:CPA2 family monovalent cation:H+ antiporter-2